MQIIFKGLKEFLRTQSYRPTFVSRTKRTFPTWKCITLGTHKTAPELSKALTDNGSWIYDQATADTLNNVLLASVETELSLVNVSVRELGFTRYANLAQIYRSAARYGLEPVPTEVGAQLLRQCTNLPGAVVFFIATEPIPSAEGSLDIFYIARGAEAEDRGRIGMCRYCRDGAWSPVCRFVFGRRMQN